MRYYSEETVKKIMTKVEVDSFPSNLYDTSLRTVERIYPDLNKFDSIEIPESPWHTGMPTEEDVKDIDEDNAYCFAICMFYDKWWLSDYLFKANIEKGCFEAETAHDGILEIPFERGYQWQKIEPYKEKSE